MKNITEIGAWIGMVLIHCATLPVSLGILLGYSNDFPPFSMVIMVWAGLGLFLVRSIVRFDYLYLISNSIGFLFQSLLLGLMLIGES